MNAPTAVNKGFFRFAVLTAALGLGMAFGGAEAKSPANGGAGGNNGRPGHLAALLEEISVSPDSDRTSAADAFVAAAAGSNIEDVIDVALPVLEDEREEQRYYALVGLGAAALSSTENGEKLGDVALALVTRLYDDQASVREAAAATMAAVHPAPPDRTGGPLTDLLDDPEPRVVSAAMRALERLPADYAGLDAVQTMAEAENAADRSRAVRLLGVPGDGAMGMEATSMLIWALHDTDAEVRWQATTALGSFGDAGRFALRDLYAMSRDRNETPENRRAAETAFNTILD